VEALPYLEELRGDIEESVFCLRGPDRRRQARGADRRDPGRRASRPRKAKAEAEAGTEITSVTVSIGVADSQDVKQGTVQQVIAAADKALYRAKAGGRNRVETPGGRAHHTASKMTAVSHR
jgi:GGDEF domain-containing protein